MIRRPHSLEEMLQRCLERIENGASIDACIREYPSYASELLPLLEAAQEIRSWEIAQQSVAARQAVRVRAHAALAAQRDTAPLWFRTRGSWHHTGRLAGRYAAAFAFVFALVGTSVAAAQDDLPGDMLYSVKLGSEQVRLGLARNSSERARLHLDFADRRLNECLALSASQRSLEGTLEALKSQYAEAWDAINLLPPEERNPLVELYQNEVRSEQQEVASALRVASSETSRATLEQVLEAVRGAREPISGSDVAPVPEATPSGQRTSDASSPTPNSAQSTSVDGEATATRTLTPGKTSVPAGLRTATVLQTPGVGVAQPTGTTVQTPSVRPLLRTETAAPTKQPAETAVPQTQPATVVSRPSPRPTNVVRPSPRPTNVVRPSPRPTNTARPSPRPTNEARPSPTTIQPSSTSTIIQPSPEATEIPRTVVPTPIPEPTNTNIPGSPQPTNGNRPEPQPTNENRPEPQPTSENRPEPQPTSENKPEPQPTNENRPEPQPTNENRPEPRPTNENRPDPQTDPRPQL